MAEKVEIVGGGDLDGAILQNAASEATLLRLVAAMEKMGGSTSGQSAAAKTQQLATAAQQQNTTATQQNTTQTKQSTAAVGNFSKSVQDATNRLASFARNAFTGTLEALGALSSELLLGGDKFSDFTKHLSGVPIVGQTFHTLAGFLDKNIETYRSLSQVGATFGNDLFEMRKAAASAGLPLDQFAAAVQNNANLLAVFGESSSDGAKRFAEVSKNLRTGRVGQQLMAMGFTMADVNDSLISYMDIQSRNGRLESMSTQQLAEEAADYAMEMDRLSRLTGIQRKELEKAVQANQTDARMRSMRSKLEGDALKNFDANMALIDKQVPGLSTALKDLADGVANTEEGQKLLAIGGRDFADLMTKAAKGMISPEELQNGLARLAPRLEQFAASIGEAGLQQLEKTQPALYAILSNAHELNRLTKKSVDNLTIEQKARENITTFLGNFEQAIAKVRTAIETSLLNSAVFERLKNMFGDFAEKGGGALAKISESLPGYVDKFLLMIENFIKRVEQVGLGEAIKEKFNEILGGLKGFLGDVIGSAFKSAITDPKVIAAMVAAIGVMGVAAGAKAAIANKVSGALGGGTGGIVPGAGGAGAAGGAGIGATLKSMASGLAAFANPAALMGLGAITLAVNGFAAALRIAGPALEPFGNMIKSVFEGLKPVLEGFAEVLRGFGDGFKSIFEGIGKVVESVGGAIAKNISSVADGIGKVVGKISEYKTAGITATTDQIKQLSSIPSDNLNKTATGITSLKKALDGFSPGLFSGISSGLGSMFGGDQAEKITQLADAGERLEPLGGYILGISDGLKTFETIKFDSIDIGTGKLRALNQQVNATADAFKRIEGTAFDKISEKLTSVTASLKEVGSNITSSIASTLGIGKPGEKKKTQEELLTDIGSKLDRLNSLTTRVIEIQHTTADASKKTAKYTKQATDNLI